MELVRPPRLAEFAELARPYLVAHEAEHGLLLSVAADAARGLEPRGAYWALAVDGGRVAGVALRTAVKLLLSREARPDAMALIARDVFRDPAARPETQAVLGPGPAVHAFAEGATAAVGVRWRPGMAQRIYVLRAVVTPGAVTGERRAATAADQELLVRWTEANAAEADHGPLDEADRRAVAAGVERRVAEGAVHLWAAGGEPVSMAAATGPTPRGVRLTGVYTPPGLRGRGYASALVAALSQHLLDAGREFVFLYTDLANPTSNRIYQRVGYRAEADALELWVDGGA